MGINARMRYGIAWVVIRTVVPMLSWVAAGVMLVNEGLTMSALWFSSELRTIETARLIAKMAEEASQDD